MTNISIGGINGVGKSTLIDNSIIYCNLNIPVFRSGNTMRKYLNMDLKDDFLLIPEKRRKEAENYRFKYEEELYRNNVDFISDMHFSIKLKGEYVSLLKDYHLLSDLFIIIVSEPEDILKFRKNDDKKRVFDIEEIIRHQNYEITTIKDFSKNNNKKLEIIHNKYGSKNESLTELSNFIMNTFKN